DRADVVDDEARVGQAVGHALPGVLGTADVEEQQQVHGGGEPHGGGVVDEVLDDDDPGPGPRRAADVGQRPAGAVVVPLQDVLDDVHVRPDRDVLAAVAGHDGGPAGQGAARAQPRVGVVHDARQVQQGAVQVGVLLQEA